MTTLKYLVFREVLDHLRTFRFTVMVLLVQAIALTGVILAVKQDRQERTLYEQIRSETRSRLEKRMNTPPWRFVKVFRGDTRFFRVPSPVSFVAGGGDRHVPNLFRVSAFRVKGPEYVRPHNPAMRYSEQIDWGFVVGVVLSLTALVLTFDAISRERAENTFQLVMSNSVRRSTIIAGKVLGAFLPIMATWCLAAVLQLLVWNLLATAPLRAQDWIAVALAGLPVALFVAFFVILGILISLLFHSPGACGTVAALCWALFVLVIPNAGQLVAFRLEELPDPRTAEGRAEAANSFSIGAIRPPG